MKFIVASPILIGSALLLALFAPGASAAPETIETVQTRPGVSTSFIVTPPDGPPVATAILFAGGDGNLKLWRAQRRMRNNFLVRSRALFARAGVLALTIDAPSDRRGSGLEDFRDSTEHRTDVAAVIRWARTHASAPIWLIGTSRGTVSVAHLSAADLDIDGAVLSASVTDPGNRDRPTALDADLRRVRVPVLLAHHAKDDCYVTPPEGVDLLRAELKRAPKVKILMFRGGRPPISKPCQARSEHGFFGIEDKVVGAIVAWMVATTPASRAPR